MKSLQCNCYSAIVAVEFTVVLEHAVVDPWWWGIITNNKSFDELHNNDEEMNLFYFVLVSSHAFAHASFCAPVCFWFTTLWFWIQAYHYHITPTLQLFWISIVCSLWQLDVHKKEADISIVNLYLIASTGALFHVLTQPLFINQTTKTIQNKETDQHCHTFIW